MNVENNHCFYTYPLEIRNVKIPTRFFLAPINTGYVENGSPTEALIKFHDERSGKNIGISYVGNIAISPEFVTNDSTAFFSTDLTGWNNLTKVICKNGSIPGAQLGCKASKISSMKEWTNENPELYIKNAVDEFKSYSARFFKDLIELYLIAAENAISVGFKVVQIHAAHGYLLSLSMSEHFNKRTDNFGDKSFLVLEIIRKIRNAFPEIILDLRISLLEGILGPEEDIEGKSAILKTICSSGIDILSISSGIYNINKRYIYPDEQCGFAPYLKMVSTYAEQYPNIYWNVAGNLYDLDRLKKVSRKNLTYSLGRSLIADPYFIEKYANNNTNTIRFCNWCRRCHYYSNGDGMMKGCNRD